MPLAKSIVRFSCFKPESFSGHVILPSYLTKLHTRSTSELHLDKWRSLKDFDINTCTVPQPAVHGSWSMYNIGLDHDHLQLVLGHIPTLTLYSPRTEEVEASLGFILG